MIQRKGMSRKQRKTWNSKRNLGPMYMRADYIYAEVFAADHGHNGLNSRTLINIAKLVIADTKSDPSKIGAKIKTEINKAIKRVEELNK